MTHPTNGFNVFCCALSCIRTSGSLVPVLFCMFVQQSSSQHPFTSCKTEQNILVCVGSSVYSVYSRFILTVDFHLSPLKWVFCVHCCGMALMNVDLNERGFHLLNWWHHITLSTKLSVLHLCY